MNGGTLVLKGKQGLHLDPGGTNHLGGKLRWNPKTPRPFVPENPSPSCQTSGA